MQQPNHSPPAEEPQWTTLSDSSSRTVKARLIDNGWYEVIVIFKRGHRWMQRVLTLAPDELEKLANFFDDTNPEPKEI